MFRILKAKKGNTVGTERWYGTSYIAGEMQMCSHFGNIWKFLEKLNSCRWTQQFHSEE